VFLLLLLLIIIVVVVVVVTHKQVAHHLKFKFNPCQHGLIKSKSTTTNLVAYLDFITPLVHFQGQAGVFHVDFFQHFRFSSAHALPLREIDYFGLSPA